MGEALPRSDDGDAIEMRQVFEMEDFPRRRRRRPRELATPT